MWCTLGSGAWYEVTDKSLTLPCFSMSLFLQLKSLRDWKIGGQTILVESCKMSSSEEKVTFSGSSSCSLLANCFYLHLDSANCWQNCNTKNGTICDFVQWHNRKTCCDISSDLRATPLVLSIWPCKLKLDEEKSKTSLAQQKKFGPAFLHNLLRLVKGTANPNTCQRWVY
jgi:hypothetical protein